MKTLNERQLSDLCAGSKNCGNGWQTYWVTTTCAVAGGMIGLAAGGIGSSVGSLLGKAACSWICYYG